MTNKQKQVTTLLSGAVLGALGAHFLGSKEKRDALKKKLLGLKDKGVELVDKFLGDESEK